MLAQASGTCSPRSLHWRAAPRLARQELVDVVTEQGPGVVLGVGRHDGGRGPLPCCGGGERVSRAKVDDPAAGPADDTEKRGLGSVLRDPEAEAAQVAVEDRETGTAGLPLAVSAAEQPLVDGEVDAMGVSPFVGPSGAVRSQGAGQAFRTDNAARTGFAAAGRRRPKPRSNQDVRSDRRLRGPRRAGARARCRRAQAPSRRGAVDGGAWGHLRELPGAHQPGGMQTRRCGG